MNDIDEIIHTFLSRRGQDPAQQPLLAKHLGTILEQIQLQGLPMHAAEQVLDAQFNEIEQAVYETPEEQTLRLKALLEQMPEGEEFRRDPSSE
jgi:hypothetical protein